VAILRTESGRHPHDRELSDVVGELATQSEEFRGLWAAHNVRLHTKGIKRFNHPIVGDDVTVVFDRLDHDHDGDSSATRAARGPAARFRHTLAAVL
jgi:hypothetical protein